MSQAIPKSYILQHDIWDYPPRLLPQPKIRRPFRRWQVRCLYIMTAICLAIGLVASGQAKQPVINRQIGSLAEMSPKTTPAISSVKAVATSVQAAKPPAPAPNPSSRPLPSDTSNPAGLLSSIGSGSYSYGQCTYYVASRRYVPRGWGNASQWLEHAKAAGFHTDTVPVPSAIAWTGAGWVGHVAYVEQVSDGKVLISEMNNWGARGGGWNRVNQRWVNTNEFKYIY